MKLKLISFIAALFAATLAYSQTPQADLAKDLATIKKAANAKVLTVEESIEALDALGNIEFAIGSKEVVVDEPEEADPNLAEDAPDPRNSGQAAPLTESDLQGMSTAKLRKLAIERGISPLPRRKADLIQALK